MPTTVAARPAGPRSRRALSRRRGRSRPARPRPAGRGVRAARAAGPTRRPSTGRCGRRPGRRAPPPSSRPRRPPRAPAPAADRQPAHRPGEGQRRLVVSAEHLRLTPSRSRTPSVNTDPLAASRVAEVAQNRVRSGGTPWSRRIAAYSSIAANARSSASSASRPVRSTPCPSRTIRDSRTRTSSAPSTNEPTSSLTVLVPQSSAATGSPTGSVRLDAGPRCPPVTEQRGAPRRRAG